MTCFPVAAGLGITDPMGTPPWFGAVSPLAGIVALIAAGALRRLAVRRYRSTGS